jgi:hypothetical protein
MHSKKWSGHPNLRLRPAKPALGNGRVQRQVNRAFMVSSTLSTSEVLGWVYARRQLQGRRIVSVQRSSLARETAWVGTRSRRQSMQ